MQNLRQNEKNTAQEQLEADFEEPAVGVAGLRRLVEGRLLVDPEALVDEVGDVEALQEFPVVVGLYNL